MMKVQLEIYEQQILAMIHAIEDEESDFVAFVFLKAKLMETMMWLGECSDTLECDHHANH